MATVKLVLNRFPELKARLAAALPAKLEQAGADMRDIASDRSRRRTGRLEGDWDYRVIGTRLEVYSPTFWSVFNEYGTVKMSAQPMIRPAAAEVFPRFVDEITKAVRDGA